MTKWNRKTPFVKGHKCNLGKKRTQEFRDRIKGAGNFNWHGDNVTFFGLHTWVKRNWGRPKECEVCGSKDAPLYDWANLNHQYNRERKFWKRMCRSCHMKYDYAMGFRTPRK